MNRWQKIAWFNLIVIAAGFIFSIIAAYTLPPEQRLMPPNRVSIVIIVSLVLVAMAKSIFRKKAEVVDLDERDKQIHRKAKFAGWMSFALSITVGVMVCYFCVGPKGSFSPLVLPVIAVIGGGVCIMVESIAALIQYGWGGKDGR